MVVSNLSPPSDIPRAAFGGARAYPTQDESGESGRHAVDLAAGGAAVLSQVHPACERRTEQGGRHTRLPAESAELHPPARTQLRMRAANPADTPSISPAAGLRS